MSAMPPWSRPPSRPPDDPWLTANTALMLRSGTSLRSRTVSTLTLALILLLVGLNLPLRGVILGQFSALEQAQVTASVQRAQASLVHVAEDRGVPVTNLAPADVAVVRELSQLELGLFRSDAPAPPDVVEARSVLLAGQATVVRPRDSITLAGYGLLGQGRESVVVRVVISKTLTNQGEMVANYAAGLVAAICLLYGAVSLILIERGALSPLARLSAQVGRLGHNGDRGARLVEDGNDEIGLLARSINRMLAAREQANEARLRAETEQDRLALENRLLEAQRSEGLQLMAGAMAHELNNILTIILGSVELVKAELPEGSELAGHLSRAEEATARAGRLSAQLLAFSGRGRIYSQQFDLSQLLAAMGEALRAAVPRTVQLAIEAGAGPALIEADPVQIRQLVLNLVINAAEAIGEAAGAISITLSRRGPGEVGATVYRSPELGAGPYIALEVQDTGPGIAPERMARLFEPFFSTRFTGRGLGLPAVLGIVRSHRGALELRSSPGEGTAVTAVFREVL